MNTQGTRNHELRKTAVTHVSMPLIRWNGRMMKRRFSPDDLLTANEINGLIESLNRTPDPADLARLADLELGAATVRPMSESR